MKILGILKPFLVNQEFYVYDNGNKIDSFSCYYEQIPQMIMSFSEKYKINTLELIGAKTYAAGLKNQIQEYELKNYSTNNLEIILK